MRTLGCKVYGNVSGEGPAVHLVHMVMNVLFSDYGSWLDFIAPVVDEWVMLCIVEEVLTAQN